MLACTRCTLTHSPGWAAVPVGLELGLGLAAMNASREAETVAVGEVWDDDGDAEPGWDGEPVAEVEAEAEVDAEADVAADGEPEAGLVLMLALVLDGDDDSGVLPGVLPAAGAVGEAEVDDAEGDGEGGGDVVGSPVGVGVGVGVLAAGSTAHLVSVFALALAEVLGLGEAARTFTVPARATPGQPASTPRVREPPASRLSTAARTCTRRMNIALSTLLIGVTVCSLWDSEATG
jgi:hypothetical protein